MYFPFTYSVYLSTLKLNKNIFSSDIAFSVYFPLDAGILIAAPIETYLLEEVKVQSLFDEFQHLIASKC